MFGSDSPYPHYWMCARGEITDSTDITEVLISTLFGAPSCLDGLASDVDFDWKNVQLGTAAMGGHLEALKRVPAAVLALHYLDILKGVLLFRGGQREVGTWLDKAHPQALLSSYRCIHTPSSRGDTVALAWVIQLLSEGGDAFPASTVRLTWERAGLNSRVNVIQWLLAQRPDMRTREMMLAGAVGAAAVGCLDVLTLLRPLLPGDVIISRLAAPAARCGRMRPLKALRALQPPFPLPASLLVDAASGGQREVIEYLQSRDGGGPHPWSKEVTAAAARAYHQDLLKWLVVDKKCLFDIRAELNALLGR